MSLQKRIKFFLITVFIFLGVVSRFWRLDSFPTGMSHDELEYVLSAKTYFQEGADLSGVRFPESVFRTKTNGVISFLPAIILAPIYGSTTLTQESARLPYAILNILTSIVLFFLVWKLFENVEIGLISTMMFLFSPWSFYLSRMASDTAWSLFFGLLAMLLLLTRNKWSSFGSYLSFVAMFFSYHGAKVIMPLLLATMATAIGIKRTKWVLIGVLMTILVWGVGLIMLSDSIYYSRQSDLVFLNKKLLSGEVDRDRMLTIESEMKPFFENKLSKAVNIFAKKYLEAWSPSVMFFEGDGRSTYRFVGYGLWHVFDIVFLFFGCIFLIKKREKLAKWWLVLILIAPIATGISSVETSVINRSFLMLPLLIVIAGYGIWEIESWVSKKNKLGWIVLPTIILYGALCFWFFYFYRWPKINQESYALSERVMANYIARSDEKEKIVAISDEPRAWMLETFFYKKKEATLDISTSSILNAKFTNKCPEIIEDDTTYIVSNTKLNCFPDKAIDVTINEEEFGGRLINIINDTVCKKYKLKPWVTRKIDDYKIESMNVDSFCQRWIMKNR